MGANTLPIYKKPHKARNLPAFLLSIPEQHALLQQLQQQVRTGIVAVTGPNGVGKTTLSRCLCGLLREQAGDCPASRPPPGTQGAARQPSA
ncbi:MAG: ATP-binding cassette domain-containing protein [Eubacteriales bacterium]